MKPLSGSTCGSLAFHRTVAAPGGRTALLGNLLIALLFTAPATADPVVVQGAAGTAQGNQTNGILSGRDFNSPPVQVLNVNTLTDAIRPGSGSAGIGFTNTVGGNVAINAGDAAGNIVIITSGNQAVGIAAESRGTPGAAPLDDFLQIPIPGQPEVAGGVVEINGRADITTAGTGSHGILAQSRTTGYGSDVVGALENFSANRFSFAVIAVTNANGSAGTVGQPVQGTLIGTNGGTLPGNGGTFTLNSTGGFNFDPGTNFNDLAAGQIRVSSVTYVLSGSRDGVVQRTDIVGQLFVTVTNTGSGLQVIGSESYFSEYGESSLPQSASVVFPDLGKYVQGLIRTANDAGGGGNSVTVTDHSGAITTTGSASHGIFAESAGKAGAGGQNGGGFFSFGTRPPSAGTDGNRGGDVSVTVNGSITNTFKGTASDAGLGVFAFSRGGDGGRGGNGGTYYNGRRGGTGGGGGEVEVHGNGTIHTLGDFSTGIFALSEGGNGGNGGDGGIFTDGLHGGYGGQGGNVLLDGLWNITTEGDKAHGIWAKSVGGNAGAGGSGGWLFGSPGGGGQATDGGSVSVTSGGSIETWGADSFGIYAQSVGGFGGSGGSGGSIFYSAGGDGNSAGSGGRASVTNHGSGSIITHGDRAHALFVQSIGGGGGSGGGAAGLAGVGGDGASGGNGGKVEVSNDGQILTLGENARGIYAQSVGGGGGDGGDSGGLVAIGGKGSGTSGGGDVTVRNTGTIITAGTRSSAIFAESIGGGGGDGGSSAGWFSVGGRGGGGGSASNVTVLNSGQLFTTNSDSSAIFAQSVGGGGGNGGGAISAGAFGSLAIGGNGEAGGHAGDLVFVDSAGPIGTKGDRSHGIFAQSVGGGGGNGGYAVSASAGTGISLSVAIGGEGGGGGEGRNVAVESASGITTRGDDAHGIFAQSVGGGGGSGGFSIAVAGSEGFSGAFSMGGSGGKGGDAGSVAVGEFAPVTGAIDTWGDHSYGILAQSVGGGGGDGGFSIAGTFSPSGGASLTFGGSGSEGGAGSNVVLNSGSTINTRGNDAHGLFAQSVGGGGGSGGFSIAGNVSGGAVLGFSFGGSGGAGNRADRVTLTSVGESISTIGERSYGILAQSVGGGGGDGGFSVAGGVGGSAAVNFSMGGSGGGGGVGGVVNLTNASSIYTFGSNSHAIFAQSVGGGGGSGGFSVAGSIALSSNAPAVALSIGGKGATGAMASAVSVVTTDSEIFTGGEHAFGILAQSVGGGGGDGGFSVAGGVSRSTSVNFSMGGKGGQGGDGGTVSVLNDSSILTTGRLSHGVFAQSVGGGGGSGGYSAAGSLTFGTEESKQISVSIGGDGGAGGAASDVDVLNSGSIVTLGTRGFGIFAQSVGGGGGDGGESKVINRSFGSVPTNDLSAAAQSGGGDGGWSLNVAIGAGGDGGSAGRGGKVKVTNAGSITNFGSGAIGIFAQSVGGGGGAGGLSATDAGAGEGNTAIGLNFSLGGKGGGGGAADSVTVNSTGSIVTLGDAAHGVMAQSVGGGGGVGGASASTTAAAGSDSSRSINVVASIGGSGGVGGNGSNVVVLNDGLIDTAGVGAYGILAQSIGGGGGHGGEAKVETKEEDEEDNGSLSFRPASGSQTNGGGKGWSVDLTFGLGGKGGSAGDGGSVIVTNTGDIVTRSNSSIGIFAQSVGGGGGAGGLSAIEGSGGGGSSNVALSISLGGSVGGAGGGGGSASQVLVNSQGSIVTLGEAAHGIMAQSIGGGGGAGGASAATRPGASADWNVALTASIGGNGGVAGDGGEVAIANVGTIDTFGAGAYGVLAQSIGGGGGHGGTAKVEGKQQDGGETNSFVASASSTNDTGVWSINLDIGAGGSGGSAGNGGRVTVTNIGGIVTRGSDAHAIFAQSVGGGGGAGGISTTDERSAGGPTNITIALGFSLGGKGGEGGSGDFVVVNSQGSIVTLGDASHGIMAQSIGGGGGSGGASITTRGAGESNGPTISLSASLGGGGNVAGDGSNVVVRNEGSIDTAGVQSYGILAQSIGGGGGQAGLGRSISDSTGTFSLGVSVGGSGGSSGSGGQVAVTNLGNVTTRSNDSHGIFAQSIGGGGGDGGNAHGADARSFKDLNITIGGSSGSSGNGGVVSIFNAGNVTTLGDGSFGILAQSIGGGGGVGGTADIGLLGVVGIGGGGGAAGNGADVTVTHNGRIDTFGVAAHGIFAQSIGGGGGLAGNVDRGLKDFLNIGLGLAFGRDGGNAGSGGVVAIETDGDIITRGTGAHGIYAQSVGGGGGLLGDLGLGINFAGSVGGSGDGGDVRITHRGNIFTLGDASHGIFAQSAGSNSSGVVEISLTGNVIAQGSNSVGIFAQSVAATGMNGDVSLALYGGSVQGGTGSGAAVRFGGGRENFLHNFGTVSAASPADGYAIIGTDGNDTIQNDGIITGSVDLGGGRNTFNNYSNGRFNAGPVVNLGAGSQLINAGTIAPGGDTAIQTTTLSGNLRQTTNGTLRVKLSSPSLHDRLDVNGAVNLLGGTLAVARFNDFVPKKGDQFAVLAATEGVLGSFANLQDPFKGNYAIHLGLFYSSSSVTVLTLQDSFRQFAHSGNQRAVARNLDSFSGLDGGIEDPRGATLIEMLNAVPGRMLPEKFDRIAPEELGSMFDVSMASAAITAGNTQRRMADARAGRAISGENLSLFDPLGRREVADRGNTRWENERSARTPAGVASGPSESRWGFFASGHGEFVDVETTSAAAGYDTRSAGLTLGVDYRVEDNWLLGVTAGGVDTKADLANDGRVDVNGGKGGLYATWFDQGIYLDAAVGGGYNSYETRRDALDGYAKGSTSGAELDALLGGGFEFKREKLTIGPTLALQYTFVGIDGFTESGSAAPLRLDDNDSHSLASRVGARAAYEWTTRGLTLRPEVQIEWQHEYLDTDRALDSRFASGVGTLFQVRSVSIGRDSVPVTAGLSVRLSQRVSASAYYSGQFARANYTSHGVNGGFRFDF